VKARILLAEDDLSLGQSLKERLTKEDYDIHWTQTGAEAQEALKCGQHFHLAVLDVGLPDMSGFELAASVRELMPVVLMTAMNSAENRLLGYDAGADEFIPKPFHMRELLLRIEHVLASHRRAMQILVNGREIDLMALTIKHGEETGTLQPRDAQVLRFLVERSPKVVRRDEILDAVWGKDRFPSERTVDNAIVRLRAALGDAEGNIIRSVRGIGYQWGARI
jgi:two-component system, OmpR family, phosphate regulon response regulator PhoB